MLFENETFEGRLKNPVNWTDNFFRYCKFANVESEGGSIESVFIGCTFNNCEWYWGLFNQAVLVQVKFEGCKFRGTSFSGCKFVECQFLNCEFTVDNLNGECSFNDVAWYKCRQSNCVGLAEEFRNKS